MTCTTSCMYVADECASKSCHEAIGAEASLCFAYMASSILLTVVLFRVNPDIKVETYSTLSSQFHDSTIGTIGSDREIMLSLL